MPDFVPIPAPVDEEALVDGAVLHLVGIHGDRAGVLIEQRIADLRASGEETGAALYALLSERLRTLVSRGVH